MNLLNLCILISAISYISCRPDGYPYPPPLIEDNTVIADEGSKDIISVQHTPEELDCKTEDHSPIVVLPETSTPPYPAHFISRYPILVNDHTRIASGASVLEFSEPVVPNKLTGDTAVDEIKSLKPVVSSFQYEIPFIPAQGVPVKTGPDCDEEETVHATVPVKPIVSSYQYELPSTKPIPTKPVRSDDDVVSIEETFDIPPASEHDVPVKSNQLAVDIPADEIKPSKPVISSFQYEIPYIPVQGVSIKTGSDCTEEETTKDAVPVKPVASSYHYELSSLKPIPVELVRSDDDVASISSFQYQIPPASVYNLPVKSSEDCSGDQQIPTKPVVSSYHFELPTEKVKPIFSDEIYNPSENVKLEPKPIIITELIHPKPVVSSKYEIIDAKPEQSLDWHAIVPQLPVLHTPEVLCDIHGQNPLQVNQEVSSISRDKLAVPFETHGPPPSQNYVQFS